MLHCITCLYLLVFAQGDAAPKSDDVRGSKVKISAEGLYKNKSGEFEAKTIDKLTLPSIADKKDLKLRITYPSKPGKYPVIVFSHGMYGSKDNYQPLVKHWVSHGYVVIQPTHSDSISEMSPEERRKTIRNPKLDKVGDWQSRPRDIKLILDSFALIEKSAPEAFSRMYTSLIGVGGHSFGAQTTQLIAGTTARFFEPRQFTDDRPKAFLVISGNGITPLFDKASFAGVKKPTLFISGDNDLGRKGEEAPWRKHAFENASPGDKYLLWIKGAYHDFGGISGVSPRMREALNKRMGNESELHLEIVKANSLAFWDTYLKSDAAARNYLTQKQVEKSKEATLQRK